MNRLSGLVAVCLLATAATATGQGTTPTPDKADAVFGLTKTWDVRLRVTAENWKSMQPKGGPAWMNPPPPPPPNGAPPVPPAVPAGPPARFRPGDFGYEFTYMPAEVSIGDQTFKEVGLRFKGNGTYMMSAQGSKRSFKVDFARHDPEQSFFGMKRLNLHNNIMDLTNVRQALAFPVFQRAGVPACRTAFAEVRLTIDGEMADELLGVYTIVEDVDERFLKRHFADPTGLLLKPEGTQGLEYLGDDWSKYEWFGAKTEPTEAQAKRVIDFVRFLLKSDDATFEREIGDYLEIDEFLRFLAVNAWLSNMDSFLTHVHNYYVYLDPKTNKFVLIPWDLDLAWGAFLLLGSPEQLQQLNLFHPQVGEAKVIDRLLAIPAHKETYRKHLMTLNASFADDGPALRQFKELTEALRAAMGREAEWKAKHPPKQAAGPFGSFPNLFAQVPPVDEFIRKRRDAVADQLAGKSEGYLPRGFPGPGGPPGGGPPGGGAPGGAPGRPMGPPGPGAGGRPPGPGMFLAAPLKAAVDSDKNGKVSRDEWNQAAARFWESLERDGDDVVDVDKFAEGLARIVPPPPGASPPPGGPPPGGGPARFLALPIFRAADKDKDARVTRAEFDATVAELFEVGAGSSKEVNDDGIQKGFERLFPPPPGTGGPPPAPNAVPPRAGGSSPKAETESKEIEKPNR